MGSCWTGEDRSTHEIDVHTVFLTAGIKTDNVACVARTHVQFWAVKPASGGAPEMMIRPAERDFFAAVRADGRPNDRYAVREVLLLRHINPYPAPVTFAVRGFAQKPSPEIATHGPTAPSVMVMSDDDRPQLSVMLEPGSRDSQSPRVLWQVSLEVEDFRTYAGLSTSDFYRKRHTTGPGPDVPLDFIGRNDPVHRFITRNANALENGNVLGYAPSTQEGTVQRRDGEYAAPPNLVAVPSSVWEHAIELLRDTVLRHIPLDDFGASAVRHVSNRATDDAIAAHLDVKNGPEPPDLMGSFDLEIRYVRVPRLQSEATRAVDTLV